MDELGTAHLEGLSWAEDTNDGRAATWHGASCSQESASSCQCSAMSCDTLPSCADHDESSDPRAHKEDMQVFSFNVCGLGSSTSGVTS